MIQFLLTAFWDGKDRFDSYMEVHLLPHIPEFWTPNGVTETRLWLSVGMIASIFPGFYFVSHWFVRVGAIVFLFSAFVTDWLDGWLARTRGPVTKWGKDRDEQADKVLVLGASAALLGHWYMIGQVGWLWWILAVLWLLTAGRDVAKWWLGSQELIQTAVLPVAKLKTGVQMVSLAPLLMAEWWSVLAYGGVLLFAIATWLSLYSGWVYASPARMRLADRLVQYTGW